MFSSSTTVRVARQVLSLSARTKNQCQFNRFAFATRNLSFRSPTEPIEGGEVPVELPLPATILHQKQEQQERQEVPNTDTILSQFSSLPEGSRGGANDDGNAHRPHKWKSPEKNIKLKQPKKGSGGNKKRKLSPKRPPIATGSWVTITDIPFMPSLEDILMSVDKVMSMEKEIGIIDLDAPADQPHTFLDAKDTDHPNWLLSAHSLVSDHGNLYGWRIRFRNRSIANAFIQHSAQSPLHIAWKEVRVREWKEEVPEKLKFTDSTIRVDGGDNLLTVEHIRHLFRRYDLKTTGTTVTAAGKRYFLVHFKNASWARAAVRELQGIAVRQCSLVLTQYPRQIL